jgi:hypothetical protein
VMRFGRRSVAPIVAVVFAAAMAAADPASAASQTPLTLTGAAGPGPGRFDHVFVERFGDARAPTVLIMLPSRFGGAGELSMVGQDLVAAQPDVQVWTVDGRWQAFEDTSAFASGDPDGAFSYYLGFQPIGGRSFQPVPGTAAPYVRQWGLALYLADVRRVVLAAKARGARTVLLGGHGSGAEVAAAYATWDFPTGPGYRDLSGLVLIDAIIQPRRPVISGKEARQSLAFLRDSDPFQFLLKGLPPWAAGVFLETSAQYAMSRPQEPSKLQSYALLPRAFRPPVPVTNQALLGFGVSLGTSPASFSGLRVRSGRLADAGDPRPWLDDGRTPIERFAAAFAREPFNGVSWYWPKRLDLDLDAAASLSPDPAGRALGLRETHLSSMDLPVYALQTDETRTFFLHNVRVLMRDSEIPSKKSLLVDRGSSMSSLDPLLASPTANSFLLTVPRFLAQYTGARRAPPRRGR